MDYYNENLLFHFSFSKLNSPYTHTIFSMYEKDIHQNIFHNPQKQENQGVWNDKKVNKWLQNYIWERYPFNFSSREELICQGNLTAHLGRFA